MHERSTTLSRGGTAATGRPSALLLMDEPTHTAAFDQATRQHLATVVDLVSDRPVRDLSEVDDATLARVELVISGWGANSLVPHRDRLPRLRAVVHSAGTIKQLVDESMLHAGLAVSTATEPNARPVAEFAQAMIVLALKGLPAVLPAFAASGRSRGPELPLGPGAYGSTVGLVGASRVARAMKPFLDLLEVEVLIHDPYLSSDGAAELGWTPVDLDELLRRSDVVSLHAPSTEQTQQMIGAAQLALMKSRATLVNTARGALVDTDALTAEVLSGRLDAILDVTEPEPLPLGHPLWSAPNAWLTPHLAGSQQNEIRRLGRAALDEVERFVRGEAFARPVLPQTWSRIG